MADPARDEVWGAFALDPRDPAAAPLRASDADREVVHGVLAEAFATGRLDRAEYDERTASALAARTLGDLPPLVADLVPSVPVRSASGRVPLVSASADDLRRRAEEHWQQERRNAFFAFLGPTLVCWTIWAVASFGGFPWPAIVSAATFANFLRVVGSKGEIVAGEVRRLEKKQARELEKRQRDR